MGPLPWSVTAASWPPPKNSCGNISSAAAGVFDLAIDLGGLTDFQRAVLGAASRTRFRRDHDVYGDRTPRRSPQSLACGRQRVGGGTPSPSSCRATGFCGRTVRWAAIPADSATRRRYSTSRVGPTFYLPRRARSVFDCSSPVPRGTPTGHRVYDPRIGSPAAHPRKSAVECAHAAVPFFRPSRPDQRGREPYRRSHSHVRFRKSRRDRRGSVHAHRRLPQVLAPTRPATPRDRLGQGSLGLRPRSREPNPGKWRLDGFRGTCWTSNGR